MSQLCACKKLLAGKSKTYNGTLEDNEPSDLAIVNKMPIKRKKRYKKLKKTISTNQEGELKLCINCENLLCPCCKKKEDPKLEEANKSEIEDVTEDAICKVLTTDLPLYDNNCHLLGYLAEGTVIKSPSCSRSNDPFWEKRTMSKTKSSNKCPPECRNAKNERKCELPLPRWVSSKKLEECARSLTS